MFFDHLIAIKCLNSAAEMHMHAQYLLQKLRMLHRANQLLYNYVNFFFLNLIECYFLFIIIVFSVWSSTLMHLFCFVLFCLYISNYCEFNCICNKLKQKDEAVRIFIGVDDPCKWWITNRCCLRTNRSISCKYIYHKSIDRKQWWTI